MRVLLDVALGKAFAPAAPFYVAVLFAALLGGAASGAVAGALCLVAICSLIVPSLPYSLGLSNLAIYAVAFVIIVLGIDHYRWLKAKAEGLAAENAALAGKFQALFDACPSGILTANARDGITFANPRLLAMFGYAREEIIGKSIDTLLPDFPIGAPTRAAGDINPLNEIVGIRKCGLEFAVEVGIASLSNNDGNAIVATVTDISERKRLRRTEELLRHELKHRTQNLLTVIRVIAARSITGNSVSDAKATFLGRLSALMATHMMMAQSTGGEIGLGEIVRRELAACPARCVTNICDIRVSADGAQQLALIFHELATNAIKYGACSMPDGEIFVDARIQYRDSNQMLMVRWVERGGPPVAEPIRKGFGTTILLDGARHFGFKATLQYETAGVTYQMEIPATVISPALAQRA